MNRALLLICFCYSSVCSAQINEFRIYYPSDSLFKHLKIKSVIDTISFGHQGSYKLEYDTLGRQIAGYYTGNNSFKKIYQYTTLGDTLIKTECSSVADRVEKPHQWEKFVYTKKGKIAYYQLCFQQYKEDTTSFCKVEKFFYDGDDVLTAKRGYVNRHYPQSFSPQLIIDEKLLILESFYVYEFDKQNRLTVKQEISEKTEGGTVDSFFYDAKNRIIKTKSVQKNIALKTLDFYDIAHFILITYKTDRATMLSYTTSISQPPEDPRKCEDEQEDDIYFDHGLQQKRYLQFGYHDKFLVDYFIYTFY